MRVLIADDHVLFRRSLKALLEARGFDVVAEAGTGREAVEEAERNEPEIVLMDLEMPELDGLEAMRRILDHRPEVQVVMLTGFADDENLLRALEAGAGGYLLKTLDPDRFFSMLKGLLSGTPALPPELAHGALKRLAEGGRGDTEGSGDGVAGAGTAALGASGDDSSDPSRSDPSRSDPMALTERETEVLGLMAGGTTTTRDLARRLGVGERTVKFHVGNLLQKLQVGSRAEAVAYALRRHLVEPTS